MLKAYIGVPRRGRPELLPQLGYAPLALQYRQQAKAQLSKIGG